MTHCEELPRRPLRVQYVIGSMGVGGAERQVLDLLRGIDRTRVTPMVVCLESAGALAPSVAELGIPLEVIGYHGLRIKRHPVQTLSALYRLRRAIATFKPDIVHGQLFWAYVLGALAARSAGVPVVVASRLSLARFRTALTPFALRLEAAANRRTDVFIANAEAVRQDAIAAEGLPPERVRVIHNGIHPSRLDVPPRDEARRALALPPDIPVLVVVANLIAYKGHRVLFDAFARLRQQHPGAVLALLRDGVERAGLEQRARELGIDAHVRFVGSIPDVRPWLAAADLLVHPSFEEGFCNAVLEAMAAGRAVVATAVGGVPEAVEPGVTGWLVEPGDAAALATAIDHALASGAQRASAGASGRQRVIDRFMMARNVEAHEMLYNEVAARRP